MKKTILLLTALLYALGGFSQAQLQIIHNSPTPTVDIWVNGDKFLADVEFRTATAFVEVPSETNLNIGVAPSPSSDTAEIIADFDVTLADGETYIAIATGIEGDMTTPFDLAIISDARQTSNDPANVDVVVYHGSTDAPTVDVVARGVGVLVDDVSYGESTDYLEVAAGNYVLDITDPADNNQIVASFSAPLSTAAGAATTVFASGFLNPATMDDPAFGLFAVLPDGTVIPLPEASREASLQIIHNSPTPTVDIWVNGDKFLDSFAYRTATPFVTVPAGTTLEIGVAPSPSTDTSQIIETFDVVLSPDQEYVVIATGIVGDVTTPFDVAIISDARQTSNDPANVDVVVYHGSTDAPTVDVVARGVGVLVDDVSYGESTDYLEIPAGNYVLDITDPVDNDQIVASFSAPLATGAGAAATVFASGFLNPTTMDDPAFGLFAVLADGMVIPLPQLDNLARLQVLHNSPSPVVDVWLNGSKLLDSFAYRTATPFIDAPAGRTLEIGVAVYPSSDTSDIIQRFNVTLEPDGSYVAIANGIVGNTTTPFELVIIEDALESAGDMNSVAFTVFHGSTDAPQVDVALRNVAPGPQGLSYGEFTDYIEVPAQDYIVDINATGDPMVLFSYEAPLSGFAGGAGVVFASGFVADTSQNDDFGLYLLLPDSDIIPLPLETVSTTDIVNLGLTISPSLTTGENITLTWDQFQNQTNSIHIVGQNGVLAQPIIEQAQSSVTIQTANLTKGAYQVILRSDRGMQIKSFVVQ